MQQRAYRIASILIVSLVWVVGVIGLSTCLSVPTTTRSLSLSVQQNVQVQTSLTMTSAPISPLPTVTPTPIPTLAVWVTPELPPIVWSAPPPCQNQPQTVAAWQQQVRNEEDKAQTRLFFQRVQRLSPLVKTLGNADQIINLFLQAPGNDRAKGLVQDKLGLWLNVVHGQINRASEIQIDDLPEVKTVKDLTQLAEQNITDPMMLKKLRKAVSELLDGKAITDPACTHLLIMQTAIELQSQVWKRSGIIKTTYDVRSQITKDRWWPEPFQISPDYQKLVFMSRCCVASGGPIFLYDLSTRRVNNLNLLFRLNVMGDKNQSVAETEQSQLWTIIGWHPDSRHLLLGIEDQAMLFWLDFQKMTYEKIELDATLSMVSTDYRSFDLLPDGKSFVYVSSIGDEQFKYFRDRVTLFDLTTRRSRILFEWSDEDSRLYFPRVSSTGEQLAFLVESRISEPSRTYSLQVYNFRTQAITIFATGSLGFSPPVWSPNGQKFAFSWSAPEYQGYPPMPEVDGWVGNLWIASVGTGQIKQVTYLQGAARRPVWSLDSETLTFITHDGQVGATSLIGGKTIWQIAEGKPDFIYNDFLVYLP